MPPIDTVDDAVKVIGDTRVWAVCLGKKVDNWDAFWTDVASRIRSQNAK